MTKLHPLILPGKPSPYGPATKNGESDDPDDVEAEEISDSYEQDTESESDETTE